MCQIAGQENSRPPFPVKRERQYKYRPVLLQPQPKLFSANVFPWGHFRFCYPIKAPSGHPAQTVFYSTASRLSTSQGLLVYPEIVRPLRIPIPSSLRGNFISGQEVISPKEAWTKEINGWAKIPISKVNIKASTIALESVTGSWIISPAGSSRGWKNI